MTVSFALRDDPDVQLGGHINALRANAASADGYARIISQAELGNAIGVSQATMSKKLRGEVGITFTELLQLADFFKVSVEDLIPPRYARERVIRPAWYAEGPDENRRSLLSYTPRDSNPEPAGLTHYVPDLRGWSVSRGYLVVGNPHARAAA